MACEEHKQLAQFLKTVHSELRESSAVLGADKAWDSHCSNKDVLIKYALNMEKLATIHWKENCFDKQSSAVSRIKWSAEFCYDYFNNKCFEKYHKKEIDIGSKIDITINIIEEFPLPYKLLDVGSCYNPFKIYDFLDVLAIDLYPANELVLQCDFLNVSIGPNTVNCDGKVCQLQENSYDIVTFCFLLEYIPSSELRIVACENAYKLLKVGGVLIINTPDSKHVGANCKLMKSWRYTLATIGFSRIKYEKFKHMHCMAFRKSLHKHIAARWAIIHKEPYMNGNIQIPQDFKQINKEVHMHTNCIPLNSTDFKELPFNVVNDD